MNIEKFVKEDMGIRVRFVEEGGMELNCYDIAYGLFLKVEHKNGKYYESIRWSRLEDYVENKSFAHYWSKENSEISWLPEGDFYKLIMKMRGIDNEKVNKFQDWVAFEVLPSIRKNNFYINESITDEQKDKLIQDLTAQTENSTNLLLNNKKRKLVLETCLKDMFPNIPDVYEQFLSKMRLSGMLTESNRPTDKFREKNLTYGLFRHHEDTYIETTTKFTLTNNGINHLIKTLRVVDGKLTSVYVQGDFNE